MKRTIGLVVAVILVGAFVVACNQKPTEPTSTPAPSPTPAATEEPATTPEPSPSSQPVAEETEDHGPSNEGATYETDAEMQAKYDAETKRLLQRLIDLGMPREEAEKAMADSAKRGQQAAADEQKRLEETTAQEKELLAQQAEEVKKESDAYYYERYGLSQEEVKGKSSEELCRLFMQKHGG